MAANPLLITDFKSWLELSSEEKLLCVKEGPLNSRYNNMATWEATGCLEEKWNETIFDLVLSIMNNACTPRSGSRGRSGRISPILRMLSSTGQREDAVPYLILLHSNQTKAKEMLKHLRSDRALQRYGFCFTAQKSNITISGSDSESSSGISVRVSGIKRDRAGGPVKQDRSSQTSIHNQTISHSPPVDNDVFEPRVTNTTRSRSPRASSESGYHDGTLHSPTMEESGYVYQFTDYRKRPASAYLSSTSPIHGIYGIDNSACGMSISVRPVDKGSDSYRLATVGGVFELRPNRFFALTSAHIFTETTVVDGSSDGEFDVASPRGSSGDDESSLKSKGGRSSSSSSAQGNGQTPEEYEVIADASSRSKTIGAAFSPKQLSEFSANMLYNPALDWALIEITDPQLQSGNSFRYMGTTIRPRPGARRTKPPSGDVLVLSGDGSWLKCRSIGTKSAINPEWADGFIEAWTIEHKSRLGSCGSWVVDPITQDVIGIVVASSEALPVTWMLPSYPIFEDIKKRWGVELASGLLEKSIPSSTSLTIPPPSRSTSWKLLRGLRLPDEVLDFIQIPLNDFQTCSEFISLHQRFLTSAEVSWFDDAAIGALKIKNVPLMQQCIQRRVIINQCKGVTESQRQSWLKLLAEKSPRIIKPFFEACNRASTTIENRMKSLPTAHHPGSSAAPISSHIPVVLSSQRTSYSANATSIDVSGYYGLRYPVSHSPFDRQAAGKTVTSTAPIVDLTHLPTSSYHDSAFKVRDDDDEQGEIRGQVVSRTRQGPEPRDSATGAPMGTRYELDHLELSSLGSHIYDQNGALQQSLNPYPHSALWRPSSPGNSSSRSVTVSSIWDEIGSISSMSSIALSRAQESQNPYTHSALWRPSSPGGSSNRSMAVSSALDDLGSVSSMSSVKVTRTALWVSASQFGDPELLDPKYKVQNGNQFFVKGRVFALMYPERNREVLGGNRNQLDTGPDDSRHVVRGRWGELIFIHIKRFVVIRQRRGYCQCVPINSYRKTGVGKKGMTTDEKMAHAIIYDSRKAPPRPIIPGEEDLVKNPIAIEMSGSDTLDQTSRIHFGKIYTIEWNVKVHGIGNITEDSEEDVDKYWQEELTR